MTRPHPARIILFVRGHPRQQRQWQTLRLAVAAITLHRTDAAARDRTDSCADRPRVVRTWRFIAAPGAEVDPATLLVRPTPRSGPIKVKMRSVRPAPACEQIYAVARHTEATADPSDNPDDGEPRLTWYISRPWTIPTEFRPRSVTRPEPCGHHLPLSDEIKYKSRLGATVVDEPPTPAPRTPRRRTKVVRFDPEAELAYRKAKRGKRDLADAMNKLSNALDKMLVEATNRATWSQCKTPRRNAVWSPLMAPRTAPLIFLKQSSRWPTPRLRR